MFNVFACLSVCNVLSSHNASKVFAFDEVDIFNTCIVNKIAK